MNLSQILLMYAVICISASLSPLANLILGCVALVGACFFRNSKQ